MGNLKKNLTAFQSENLRERDHFGETGINGKILLKWFLKK
jgi:hypothetical protein